MPLQQLSQDLSQVHRDRQIQVQLIAEYILNENKIFNQKKALGGGELYDAFVKLKEDNSFIPDVPKTSFVVYLSKVSNSPDSKINCEGKRQGYYIDTIFEKIEETTKLTETSSEELEKEIIEQKDAKEKGYLLEKDLYPLLEQWLFQIDNERVADISNSRGQGKWANPDLVGLKVDNLFGATEVEITTIEAKLTVDDWQRNIFEAIAHTIFSNRSYFAFVHSESHINKLSADLKHYAERFNIGILIIKVDANDYLKITEKKSFSFTENNYEFLEYSPAPYNTPHIKFKKRFLKGLEINEPSDLFRFGKTIEK